LKWQGSAAAKEQAVAKGILVLGAGRSSRFLLEQLSDFCGKTGRTLTVCDASRDELDKHTFDLSLERKILNASDSAALEYLTAGNEMVVSLLPPFMHPAVAALCLKYKAHFASASYVGDAMRALDLEARTAGLVFLNELGLDPGIDHLSAMKAMDEIRHDGGEIISFESYCGGLVSEAYCEGNPWKYKFSWNPRNVVLAGQGGNSLFRQNNQLRSIPWHRLFAEAKTLSIPGLGEFDAYANRDSLSYEQVYGLSEVSTLLRGTLRRKHYCKNWQVLVSLGFTDAQSQLPDIISSVNDLCCALTGKREEQLLSDWLLENNYIDHTQKVWFDYLHLENTQTIGTDLKNAAEILETVLLDKWKLLPGDCDEVVMYHRIGFVKNGQKQVFHSVMSVSGEDEIHTAMAKTVGLPLALGVEQVLSGNCQEKGVVIPVSKYWYDGILPRLEQMGVCFTEHTEFCDE
jgi:saccharopine dehydrogenase-like NADP-dependent oxidoreductase